MRRLSAALAIAVLAALLLPLCVSAEPTYIPHEDPNIAADQINKDSILLYYAQIFMQIDQGDYTSAIKLLDNLDFAHIPEQHRLLLEKYSGLIGKLPSTIDSSKELLDLASSLITQYRLTEAGETLDEADGLIDQLDIYLSDIDNDTETIGSDLGVALSSPGDMLNLSYGALKNSVGLIWAIKDETANLREVLDSTLVSILESNLQKTTLTLELSAASAYVGDNITISGLLSTNQSGLKGKNVSILLLDQKTAAKMATESLDNKTVATGVTDSSGRYVVQLSLPYKYVSNMSFRAFYIPAGSDIDIYLPAVSTTENISVLFYKSEIKITPPKEIYLGLPVVFNGSVNWEQPNGTTTRNVSLYLDEDLLGTVSTGPGPFEIKTTMIVNESPDNHKVRASIANSSHYAGAVDEKTVTISKAPLTVAIDAPSFLVLPGKLSITGKVTSVLPMEGGTASLAFGGQSTIVEIQDNGEFSANLSLGIEWELLGTNDLTVTVNPAEPWIATTTVKARIFVLNAVNITTISLCLVAGATIGTLTYKRKKHRMPLAQPIQHPVSPATIKAILAATPVAKPQTGSGDNRGKLLNAYARAKDVIEKTSAIKMEPHMTMREFSKAVEKRGNAAAGNFAKLTSMTEKALYSPHETEAAEATAAEDLLSAIVEGIQHGAA